MNKSDTVYIIGAGFNQCIRDWDGLNPPLSKNFFKTMLKSKKYNEDEYMNKMYPVFKYIKKYWKLDKNNLLKYEFDLQECFTFLQLQIMDAVGESRKKDAIELLKINSMLKTMFVEFLSDFEKFSVFSQLMREFGLHIYNEKPTILTFNYDCNLEKIIEYVSGTCKNKEKMLYSNFNWNAALSYGVNFDIVYPQHSNIEGHIEGEKYYGLSCNKLYDWKILKLHGSLNWFKYIPVEKYDLNNIINSKNYKQNTYEKIILANENWKFNDGFDLNRYIVEPLIITPVIYKNYNQRIINKLWSEAKNSLLKCKKLIIIGYSFPSTDFAIRKLLIESFQDNTLENMIVVNPDISIVEKLKRLTHYDKPVLICSNLNEFLKRK
ncbi:hypothetical protein ACFIJ5_05090 [Haloimpatiens sp. FM7330]|uniref:hypothetical protein n=1 Tax=Haloimpatiens sp. FM7330 TaxID=3298610 RepID=UPI003642E774